MRKDKWYISYYGNYVFDKLAADALNVEYPKEMKLKDFTPDPQTIDPKDVNLPSITTKHTLPKHNKWNYPALIEDFEKTNPGLVFARADVKAALKHNKITLKDARDISLTKILLCPENEAQEIIRSYWLKDLNVFEVLKYIGVDKQLLDFLESYQPDLLPTEPELERLPDELRTGYLPKILTDLAMKGKFYKP